MWRLVRVLGVFLTQHPPTNLQHRSKLGLRLLQPPQTPQHGRQNVAAAQGVGVFLTQHPPTNLQHRSKLGLRLLQPPQTPQHGRQIVAAGQRCRGVPHPTPADKSPAPLDARPPPPPTAPDPSTRSPDCCGWSACRGVPHPTPADAHSSTARCSASASSNRPRSLNTRRQIVAAGQRVGVFLTQHPPTHRPAPLEARPPPPPTAPNPSTRSPDCGGWSACRGVPHPTPADKSPAPLEARPPPPPTAPSSHSTVARLLRLVRVSGVFLTQHPPTNLQHRSMLGLRLLQPPQTPQHGRQIVAAGQRVGVFLTQHPPTHRPAPLDARPPPPPTAPDPSTRAPDCCGWSACRGVPHPTPADASPAPLEARPPPPPTAPNPSTRGPDCSRLVSVSGCSSPNTRRQISSTARSSASASSNRPKPINTVARLLRLVRV